MTKQFVKSHHERIYIMAYYYNNCNSCGRNGAGYGISPVGGIDVSRPPYSCIPPFGNPNNPGCSCTVGRPCGCGNSCGCNGVGGVSSCGCSNSCGCNNACGCNSCGRCTGTGTAFFNVTGTTLATGAVIPLRFVLGTGALSANNSTGTVNLSPGTYTASYSLSATAPTTDTTITITPEISGTLRTEFARTFTTTAADQSFEIGDLFAFNIPCDVATTGSLSLIVTLSDGAASLTDVNASLVLNKVG